MTFNDQKQEIRRENIGAESSPWSANIFMMAREGKPAGSAIWMESWRAILKILMMKMAV